MLSDDSLLHRRSSVTSILLLALETKPNSKIAKQTLNCGLGTSWEMRLQDVRLIGPFCRFGKH